MNDDTWNRYCEKLEELRRLEDQRRKRRKESTAVEVGDKTLSVGGSVAGADGLSAIRTNKDD